MIDLLSTADVIAFNETRIDNESRDMALALISELALGEYELEDGCADVDLFFKISDDFEIYHCAASFLSRSGYQVSIPSGTLNKTIDDVSEHISAIMRVLLGVHIDCEYLNRLSEG